MGLKAQRARRVGVLLVFIGVAIISYLPNIVSAEKWPSYRTLITLGPLMGMYFFFAMKGYLSTAASRYVKIFFTVFLSVVVLASGFIAQRNVKEFFIEPQLKELAFIRERLLSKDLSTLKKIYFVALRWNDSMAPIVRFDEFGLPSTSQPWVQIRILPLLISELSDKKINIPVEIISLSDVAKLKGTPDTLLINMKEIKN